MEAATLLTDVEQSAEQSAEPVIEDWLMKRNCSVSPRQFVGFYASLALCSSAIALLLVSQGAWLVAPFTGIELLVVGIAFVMYARHAVDYERVRLYRSRLLIEQASAERLTQFEFNPRWVRVEWGGSPREPITLASRGQAVTVGLHLAFHRRVKFANDLRTSLRRCR